MKSLTIVMKTLKNFYFNFRNGRPSIPLNLSCSGSITESFCDGIEAVNDVQNMIFALTMVILWFRLLKIVRVSSFMGAFIVIISRMMWDLLKFVILYGIVFAGYGIAFYMVWGNKSIAMLSSVYTF